MSSCPETKSLSYTLYFTLWFLVRPKFPRYKVRRQCRVKYISWSKFLTHATSNGKIDTVGHLACDNVISVRTDEIPKHAMWR